MAAVWTAIAIPLQAARKQRTGYLETIAMDLKVADRQARIYLRGKVRLPAYRLPLHGAKTALRSVLSDCTITGTDATRLVQFYVDATSFNYCLELAQTIKINGRDWEKELSRIRLKAKHLVLENRTSANNAMSALRKHLPSDSLLRLEIPPDTTGEEAEGEF